MAHATDVLVLNASYEPLQRVSVRHAIKMLVRAALDAPLAGIFHMHLDIASVSTLDYLGDGSATLRLFNDTSHLTR